jgi:hypothetical protein
MLIVKVQNKILAVPHVSGSSRCHIEADANPNVEILGHFSHHQDWPESPEHDWIREHACLPFYGCVREPRERYLSYLGRFHFKRQKDIFDNENNPIDIGAGKDWNTETYLKFSRFMKDNPQRNPHITPQSIQFTRLEELIKKPIIYFKMKNLEDQFEDTGRVKPIDHNWMWNASWREEAVERYKLSNEFLDWWYNLIDEDLEKDILWYKKVVDTHPS